MHLRLRQLEETLGRLQELEAAADGADLAVRDVSITSSGLWQHLTGYTVTSPLFC